jgi:hypothetical protein
MKRGIVVLVLLGALAGVAYVTWSKWAIRHEIITFYDASRDNRPVSVYIAFRRSSTSINEARFRQLLAPRRSQRPDSSAQSLGSSI